MPLSPELFKHLLGRFATGVTVVTAKHDNGMHGLTVSAFSSVSLRPPLILICVDNRGTSHQVISEGDAFVVNILSEQQTDLAYRFANPKLSGEARFENLTYHASEQGIPILADTLAYLECRTVQSIDAGDHTIFVAEVQNGSFAEEKSPMVYYRGEFHTL
ncbi:MAG: flavin reductase family protein [bacterium]